MKLVSGTTLAAGLPPEIAKTRIGGCCFVTANWEAVCHWLCQC